MLVRVQEKFWDPIDSCLRYVGSYMETDDAELVNQGFVTPVYPEHEPEPEPKEPKGAGK